MESVLQHRSYFVAAQTLLINWLRISLLLLFFIFFLKLYWNRKRLENALKHLPSCQVRFQTILGHMAVLTNHYLFNYPAPFHAYHSIIMSGFPKVYGKDGMFLVWQVYHPAVMVYKAESVEMILNHSTEIKKAWFYKFLRQWLGDGLLTSEGSKWKQRRKLLTPAFHFSILRDFLPVISKQSKVFSDVLQDYTSAEYIDIVPFVTKCSFDIICETILGEEMHSQTTKDCEYLNSVIAITDEVVERILKPWLWPDLIFPFTKSGRNQSYHLQKARNFTNQLIAKKKKEKLERKNSQTDSEVVENPEEDVYHSRRRKALLDLLLDEHIQNNSISELEIREEVDTFTFEGHDTTAMAISWSLYLIGLHPEVQAKIHEELDTVFGNDDRDPTMDDLRDMKYLECVFKETLRLYPSVPGYGRQLQEDMEFKGKTIPKGCTCFIWVYLLHRDPEVFPNPEKFDPDRFTAENSANRHPFAYVPFSAGPRNCIGQKFAVMEIKSILSRILRKYTIRSLQPRDQIHDMFNVVLRPHGGLKIKIMERPR